jgi:predicted outer membrane lipoprotein
MEYNQNNFNQSQSSFAQEPIQPAPAPQTPPQTPARKTKWWVFVVGFLVIIALGIIVNALWYDYLSPAARDTNRMKEQYAQYEEWQKSYDEAMKADTYGGKTPEETLTLFIDALEKEDIDLASKYFVLNITGSKDIPTKEDILSALEKIKSEGKIELTVQNIKETKPFGYSKSLTWDSDSFSFKKIGDDGSVERMINLIFNKYSKVWKIESL